MHKSLKKIAAAGYIAKGSIYFITGILTFLAAFDLGGERAGKMALLNYLEKQPFGKILLAVLGLGLFCYAAWRFIQAVRDPENIGSGKKALGTRSGYFFSGIGYGGLGVLAIYEIFRATSQQGEGIWSLSIMNGKSGSYIFIGLGLILAVKAIYQWFSAYNETFMKNFSFSSSSIKPRKLVKRLGGAGLIARGVVIGIIAYFFLKGGLSLGTSSSEMIGTAEAFSFIQENTSGPWLLGIVAAGLICYGIFMFATAKYRSFSIQS